MEYKLTDEKTTIILDAGSFFTLSIILEVVKRTNVFTVMLNVMVTNIFYVYTLLKFTFLTKFTCQKISNLATA